MIATYLFHAVHSRSIAWYSLNGDRQIFKDPLTTAAAINRVIHHSWIIEFGREIKSFRAEEAARRSGIQLDGGGSTSLTTSGPDTAQDTPE